MTSETTENRLRAYNGGLLLKPAIRRILELAGWSVSTGVPQEDDWVGIWGRSPTSWRGEAVAEWKDAPILTVEDAPLRSVLPARIREAAPHGLLLDKTGVHFDGTMPSDMETLLRTHPLDDTHLLNRARDAIDGLKYWHLSKYSATDLSIDAPDPGYVLVIDQTEGDAALLGAGPDTFRQMLTMAAAENPASRVLVKRHPETVAGKRSGMLDDLRGVDRAEAYDAPISPWKLFEGAVGVYTHSSTLGFEAIFAGHKPRVFGHPFYAGWGLTIDEEDQPRRERTLSRAQLFAAAMILAPTWYDPVRDRLCELEDVIARLAAETRAWREDRKGYVSAGSRRWKQRHLKRALGREGGIKFVSTGAAAAKRAEKDGRRALVWGTTEAPQGTMRMEDGLLRSVGLGAALTPPMSLALDDLGIYFDPSTENRLDRLITASSNLPGGELHRAARLRQSIIRSGVTKYGGNAEVPEVPAHHQRVLVVGQVQDDASLIMGARETNTNLDLLKTARAARPNALILWKPHPDVEAGLRKGAVPEEDLQGLADIALKGTGANAAIGLADEIWTMTSTLGFEALIRGKPVVTVGMPFYAGWGLTEDLAEKPPHRSASASLDGLTHACLIGYPRYFHPVTGAPVSAEDAVWLLSQKDFPLPDGGILGIFQRLFSRP